MFASIPLLIPVKYLTIAIGPGESTTVISPAPDIDHQIIVTSWTLVAGNYQLQSSTTTSINTGVLSALFHLHNEQGIFACAPGEALAVFTGDEAVGLLTYIIAPASSSLRLLESGNARLLESTF
jgi:hypothetical protein